MPGAVLGVVSLAASAIGAGVSFISAQSAATTAEDIAASNFESQQQAISQQRQTSQMAAAINAELARKDQDAANSNADAAVAQADANSAASRDAVRFSRLEAARAAARNRAALAKGGVDMSTGSPLALMAENAAEENRAVHKIVYENDREGTALFREAAAHRTEAALAGINVTGQQVAGKAAAQKATQEAAQSKLDLYSQRASANAMRTNATGSLLTSLGTIAGTGYTLFGGKKPVKPMNKYPTKP